MKLSIITINYNDASGLEKTLESIIPHKVKGVELIVIDGGSTDTSLDVILHHKAGIDFYESEKDKGIYNAMNKGISKSKGEYILFVNSGDCIIEKTDFDEILKNISGEDLIYFNLEISNNNSKYIKQYPDILDFKYFTEDSLPHPATFIKKELFEKYSFYREDLKIISDWAFFIDCVLLYNCSYKHVNKTFSTFHLGGISTSERNATQLLEEKERHLMENHLLYFSIYKEWKSKKEELHKLKSAVSVKYIKKIGFLKWLKL